MIIAIDPGASGGIAWKDDDTFHAMPMPKTQGEVGALLRSLICAAGSRVIIERVQGYAGGKGAPGSAMFNFGYGFGWIEGALYAWGVPVEQVLPQTWQRRLQVGTKSQCATKTEWKRKLQQEAQRRFPACDVTLKTADALLILDWALANKT